MRPGGIRLTDPKTFDRGPAGIRGAATPSPDGSAGEEETTTPERGHGDTDAAEVARVIDLAAQVAPTLLATAPATRAAWLDAVADALETHAEELIDLADAETHLGSPRLPGELAKAADQLRFYGRVAAEGSYAEARIDHAAGAPAVDLRRVRRAVGPVAVFGASNFPFGFGVVGHDTGSAVAAGCPVVVKAHPAHPRLSRRLAEVATVALHDAGAPEGAFALVEGFDAGLALVDAPGIAAVGFTGSQRGGMALVQRAADRERPIPVFAEMGTVNPVVVTTAGASTRPEQIAEGFTGSFTLGVGQFCTKPGLMLAPAGSGLARLVAGHVADASGGRALTEDIAAAYRETRDRLVEAGATVLAESARGSTDDIDGAGEGPGDAMTATVVTVDARDLVPGSPLLEECFGPLALVVEYADAAERDALIGRLQPSLAAAVHGGGAGDPEVADLVARLSPQVGRVVVDGWPTGVAGTWAQHHGGPWPATSRPEASSVGAAALDRFTRAVAYQDVPQDALPPELRDDNPWALPRRVDGALPIVGGDHSS